MANIYDIAKYIWLFRTHQGSFTCSADDLKKGDMRNLSEDQMDSVNVVLRDYGDMEPYELRELSHKEDPWRLARGRLPEGAYCDNVISKESLGQYYGSL